MSHYLLRLSPAAAAFTTAVFLGHTVGNSYGSGSSDKLDKRGASAVSTANPGSQSKESNSNIKKKSGHSTFTDLMRGLESGERRHEVIQETLGTIAGNTKPIRWNAAHIKGSYKLTQIVSHVHNLDNNFELIAVHTLPDREQNEDFVTNYTSRIHESEIQNIRNSIIFSRLIEGRKGQVQFDEKSRAQYFFSVTSDSLSSPFSLRAPIGTYKTAPVGVNSFDPLSILSTNNHVFDEVGEYQYEIAAGGTEYNINIIPRLTELENLTIEVEIREIKSIETYTFVLVYEQM